MKLVKKLEIALLIAVLGGSHLLMAGELPEVNDSLIPGIQETEKELTQNTRNDEATEDKVQEETRQGCEEQVTSEIRKDGEWQEGSETRQDGEEQKDLETRQNDEEQREPENRPDVKGQGELVNNQELEKQEVVEVPIEEEIVLEENWGEEKEFEIIDGVLTKYLRDNYRIYYVTIPKTINGQEVKEIGDSAFIKATSLQYAYIPESVKIIRDNAFGDEVNINWNNFSFTFGNYRKARQFMRRIYTNCLSREADEGGINYWTMQLMKKSIKASDVLENFLSSAEFTSKNIDDRKYIEMLYQICMNRPADKDGLEYWLAQLNTKSSRKGILASMVLSNEFNEVCQDAGIERGEILYNQVNAFVDRFYRKCLGRSSDWAGENYWVNELKTGSLTGQQLAESFVLSNEFLSKNLNNEEFIGVMYHVFFDRVGDQGGIQFWLSQMAGGKDRKEILTSFVKSNEFEKICKDYGIVSSIKSNYGSKLIDQTNRSNVKATRYSMTDLRWAQTIKDYLVSDENGIKTILTVDDIIRITQYDNQWGKISTKQISLELPLFGGFYAGKQYNYIVYGAENQECDDQKEVIRIVKYDKQFNKIGQLQIYGGASYTAIPFRAGSLRMAEDDNRLVVHTSRKRYDGHQSQLTIIMDTHTMEQLNTMGEFQENHVSHSFDQYVKFDGSSHVLVDHGDAYPRSVVLHKEIDEDAYQEVNLFDIPGSTGANCTGVSVGGFEITNDAYIVGINSIEHSLATGYTSFEIQGISQEQRDVILCVLPKNNVNSGAVRQIKLTNGSSNGKTCSAPYLVKVLDNRVLVLWEEYDLNNDSNVDVRYAYINSLGNICGEIGKIEGARLSSCQPIVTQEGATWYVDQSGNRVIYTFS